jgi:hypothetical protein
MACFNVLSTIHRPELEVCTSVGLCGAKKATAVSDTPIAISRRLLAEKHGVKVRRYC